MVGGIAGQIALAAMSGGCSLFAAGSTLTRAAGLYTTLTTATGMIAATQNFANGTAGVGDALAFIPAASFGAAKLGLLCFVEDTQVVVDVNDDGSYVTRNIQDLEVGDYVLCRDQYDPNAPLVKQQIVETFAHETDAVRAVSIQDASGNVERLVTTDEHPFWVDRIGWVAAKDLLPGLVVTTASGGTAIVVENFALLLDAPAMVYNLEVANGHTYFVEDGQGTQTPVWVHNDCSLGKTIKAFKCLKAAKLEDMHLLPKQFKSAFQRVGLVIDDYVIKLEKGAHCLKAFNGVHTGKGVNNWNGAWKAFLTKEKTRNEILDELARLRELFGI